MHYDVPWCLLMSLSPFTVDLNWYSGKEIRQTHYTRPLAKFKSQLYIYTVKYLYVSLTFNLETTETLTFFQIYLCMCPELVQCRFPAEFTIHWFLPQCRMWSVEEVYFLITSMTVMTNFMFTLYLVSGFFQPAMNWSCSKVQPRPDNIPCINYIDKL